MSDHLTPADVSAIVCTLNSINSIDQCLVSLREAGVGELIVVDGGSTDGTREIAHRNADVLLEDEGLGLGAARNLGIAHSSRALILNMGSDNVMPPHQLQLMIQTLQSQNLSGVSARTIIEGENYPTRGLNAWRTGRFQPGRMNVIGTPTLFRGDLLRAHPYDSSRRFSDDSELCERWIRELDATFAISPAFVTEIGKTSWNEVWKRCRMYGISDDEVFREGIRSGWGKKRQLKSLAHPVKADFLTPLQNLDLMEKGAALPFLAAFTGMRYAAWIKQARQRRNQPRR